MKTSIRTTGIPVREFGWDVLDYSLKHNWIPDCTQTKIMAAFLPPVWVDYKTWDDDFLTETYKPATVNNVHPEKKQSALPQHGGLLLLSVLIFLNISLLCSPFVYLLSWLSQWHRGDRDRSDPGCGAGTGVAGEEWGAGGLSEAEGEGDGGKDEAAINHVLIWKISKINKNYREVGTASFYQQANHTGVIRACSVFVVWNLFTLKLKLTHFIPFYINSI